MKLAKALIITARPQQWLKNLSIFAAAFLWGDLLNLGVFPRLAVAFIIFSLLSSAAYFINDVKDKEKDKKHPIKKKRPIAAGELTVKTAVLAAIVLGVGALVYSFLNFNSYFFGIVLAFLVLQITYSFWIRNVIILDALWVAAAFVLRVFAGAFVLPTPISSWVILSVIGLSLLLAFGKRRSERTLLSSLHERFLTRETLRHYPERLLDSVISMSAAYTALAYSIFAFQSSPGGSSSLLDILPPTLSSPKLILLTVPLVIYEKKEGESPERILITDFPLLATVSAWIIALFLIIYVIGA